MTNIQSPHNPRLKALKRLQTKRGRESSGRFLVEGEDLIAAATRAGRAMVEGYKVAGMELRSTDLLGAVHGADSGTADLLGSDRGTADLLGSDRGADRGTADLLGSDPGADLNSDREGGGLGGGEFVEVERGVFSSVSTLGSGTRVIAVYEQRWRPAPQGPLCLYLHGVKDPGNVGTALRSAEAFGASVALGPGCADPHSPKAVRASMGAIFAVPIARVSDVAHGVEQLPGERIALVADAAECLLGPGSDTEHDQGGGAAGAFTLLVGAERDGLPAEVVAACERVARIPIESQSLNAAMAATVALYEMTRRPSRVTPS